jgi:hypothetical protein
MRARDIAKIYKFGKLENREVKRPLIRSCLNDELRIKMFAKQRTLEF